MPHLATAGGEYGVRPVTFTPMGMTAPMSLEREERQL